MATLTWRNVDGPDFGRSMQGYRQSADMLGNAATIWNDQIRAFAEQDKSASDLAAASQRQAMNQQLMEQTGYTNARTRDTNARLDAASPLINQYVTHMRTGNGPAAAEMLRTNPELQGLRPDQFGAVTELGDTNASNILKNIRSGIGNESAALGVNKESFNFGNEKTAFADGQMAQSFLQSELPKYTNIDEARAGINAARGRMTPGAFGAVQAAVEKQYGALFAPVGTSGTASPTAAIPSSVGSAPATGAVPSFTSPSATTGFNTVVGNGKYGQPPKELTTMTNAEVLSYGKDTLIPATRGRAELGLSSTQGSSAAGAYQITGETLQQYGERALGKDWRNLPFSAENQDKVAKAIFEDRRSGDLTKTWKALESKDTANRAPGYYKDKKWEDVRAEIAQKESATEIPSTAATRDAVSAVQGAGSDVRNTSFVARFKAAEGRSPTLVEAADDLIKGDLSGRSKKDVMNIISDAAKKAGTNNYAVAAEIVKSSTQAPISEPGIFNRALGWAGVDEEVRVDNDLVTQNAKFYKDGMIDRGVSTLADNEEFQKRIPELREKAVAANARVTELESRLASGTPISAATITKAREDAAKANALAATAVDVQRNTPAFNPDRAGLRGAAELINQAAQPVQPPAPQPVGRSGPSAALDMQGARDSARRVIASNDVNAARSLMESPGFGMLLPLVKMQIITIARSQG